MHILTSTNSNSAIGGHGSLSTSVAAFASAVGAAGITSRLVFDHQPPSRPEDVVTYLAALAATVIAGWWLANVVAWAVALRRGFQLDRFTLPGTKRIAQILLAATLSTSCVAEASGDPVMVLVDQVAETSPTTPDPLTTPSTTTSTPETTAAPTTAAPTTTPTTVQPTTVEPTTAQPDADDAVEPDDSITASPAEGGIKHHQVVVNEGDNLWSLAAETLTALRATPPTTGQIAEYWRLVVAANQVRSGNPDLIVAGEAITMPAFEPTSSVSSSQPPQLSPSVGIGAR